jgi:ABC-2 type transport system permease protein
MIKTWRVALHEYVRHVFNRRFLLGLLSVPLIVLAMVGLVFLIISMDNNTKAFGYVDHSGLLAHPVPPPPVEKPDRPIQIRAFADEEAALAALKAGQIQAYYVLPEDYLTTGKITVVHIQEVKSPARQQFYAFLTANLLAGRDPEITARAVKGSSFLVQSADGSRSFSNDNWFAILVPLIAGIAFIIAMFSAGGYLLQAMVEEKENRTMEVIITSVSPNQFMAGKVIGDTATGLTQILAWIGFILLLFLFGRNNLDFLKGIQITSQTAILFVAIMLPAFVMVAAIMAAIGATVTEAREGQQVVGFLSLPIWIPYMLTGLLMNSPNSPLAIGLSFFPLTAPLTMLMRDSITLIPVWQIAVSSAILVLSAVAAIWLAGRVFRLGMLRYGKRLAWREVFARQGAKS